MPIRHLSVLCVVLLYERMKGDVYGFRVKGVKVTNGAKVTEMAEMAEVSKITEMTARHVIVGPVAKKVVQMTARHVIHPVFEMAEVSVMTARYVMRNLGKVEV
jgi:hypothetical protein